jgi:hypothetical protein
MDKLDKIIEKAEKNGFDLTRCSGLCREVIIFSHDFAKAYWNKEIVCKIHGNKVCSISFYCGNCNTKHSNDEVLIEWEYHLQQLAMLNTIDKRIDYLTKFL